MALLAFKELIKEAEKGAYAVGYFESWNIDSLLAVADAAAEARSPVILGFSGIYLPQSEQMRRARLGFYGATARELCQSLTVPVCLLFNESPHWEWVLEAGRSGFNLVMYADEIVGFPDLKRRVRSLVRQMHAIDVAVEAEISSVPGVSGSLCQPPGELKITDPAIAADFVRFTGVDALAVNLGQAHLHGRSPVRLDVDQLKRIREAVDVPLVLHGATSVVEEDLAAAIRFGIRKVNVGSSLKNTYFQALRSACAAAENDYNPYEVIGSGTQNDVLAYAREALKTKVMDWMHRLGSAGRVKGVGERNA
jgi:fructose/tagatose bisphosphate aldolase